MIKNEDGSVLLTREEWAVVSALAYDSYPLEDTIGGMMYIGAFRVLDNDDHLVSLAREVDLASMDFTFLRQSDLDLKKAKKRDNM